MRKSGDKDFLTVLQSLETILQAQTKISKRQSSQRTPNSKTSPSPKNTNRKKAIKIDLQENNVNQEIKKIPPKTPSPSRPRKLYKNPKNNDLFVTPNKYSANSTPKIHEKVRQTLSAKVYKKEVKYSPKMTSPHRRRRVRHNSPSDQIDDNNIIDDYQYLSHNYTSSQLNTLCIFFLRWMKRCTEKIEAESNRKPNFHEYRANTFSDDQSMEKIESTNNIQNRSNSIPKPLAESDEISIERVNCNKSAEPNQIPFDKIEINVTPKSFKSSHPSSLNTDQKNIKKSDKRKKNSTSSKVTFSQALTPQQEKQYLDYLHSNHRSNHSQGNSPAVRNMNNQKNQKNASSTKIRNSDIEIRNVIKKRDTTTYSNNGNDQVNDPDRKNQQTDNDVTNKNENNTNSFTKNDNNEDNVDHTKENIRNGSTNNENYTNENTNSSNKEIDNNIINANTNTINQNSNMNDAISNNISNSGTNNLDSTENVSKLDLEETSPLPKSNEVRKMPSIGESDLNNQPNSDDIHYDSYELSEKSLSLLPPQGEGEVTDFNPSNF